MTSLNGILSIVLRRAKPDAGGEAWAAMAEIFMGAANQRRFHGACGALSINPPALKALLSMEPGVALPMRALADQWNCDASWVTSLVDGLEERGLVERRILPEDRRVKTVVLTEAGVAAKQSALDALHVAPPFMDALSVAEQRQLRDLLRKLTAATISESRVALRS